MEKILLSGTMDRLTAPTSSNILVLSLISAIHNQGVMGEQTCLVGGRSCHRYLQPTYDIAGASQAEYQLLPLN